MGSGEQAFHAHAKTYIGELGVKPTWGSDLLHVGTRDMAGAFVGVYQAHERPQPRRYSDGPYVFIQNTNSLPNRNNAHWIAVGVDHRGTLAFDSFGRNRQMPRLFGEGLRYDTWSEPDAEQHKATFVCGPLSLAFCRVFLTHGRAAAQKI